MNHFHFYPKPVYCLLLLLPLLFFSSCETEELVVFSNDAAVFLLIDEESIDNGNEPNNFSERDVNDQIPGLGGL